VSNIVQLECAGASVRLVPAAGGRISALRLVRPGAGAVDVLHPYPEVFFDPTRWAKGGIYPLMPYSNRIAHASVHVEGEDVALKPHPDAAPHTLHGNAHALVWQLAESDATSAVMTLDSPACAAWPWHYSGRMRVELTPHQLLVQIDLRNADLRVMPAGIGLHPYFRHQAQGKVAYQASTVWPPTAEFLPGAARAPQPDEIYTSARVLPAGGLTHYVGGWDGEVQIDLPDGVQLRIASDPVFSHLVVHRPDNMAYLCLEPVSHVADGFNLAARGVEHTGTRWLQPGESMSGTVRLQLLGDAT
jgi:aldose 1-epimerase